MKKQTLSKFISKYNLSGLVESVKWEIKDDTLSTSFISDDKSVMGLVSLKDFHSEDSVFGVYDTSKLVKMMSVFDEEIEFSLGKIQDKSVSIKLSDSNNITSNYCSVNYTLADISVIPQVPDLKVLPPFNANIKLDSRFIEKFVKAKSALPEDSTFAFVCDGTSNKGRIIFGHSTSNTNNISIDVECECDTAFESIYFSADYMKEILVSNKDSQTATFKISSEGLSHVHYEVDNYTCDYYLVEIKSE